MDTIGLPATGDRLLRDREAAEVLHVSPKTLANQRSRGEGPRYVKFPNGAVRYRMSDLLAEIESCVVTPGGDAT